MEIFPECYLCLERLAELTVDLATSEAELRREALWAAREIMGRMFSPQAIPAVIATHYHRAIQEITGNPDPFASRKAAETAYLAAMYQRLAPAYGEDLGSLLQLAVRGNAVDVIREEDEVTRDLLSPVDFEVFDLSIFRRLLEGPRGLLLFLADNTGEQFFDLPLVTYLRGQEWRVLYVVKGGAVQNDITRADLYASGLGLALEPVVDTGACTVGLVLGETSPEFQRLYEEAQLILAKGMGHFETLSHLDDPRLFFLLEAKCGPVARALEVPRGSCVFTRAPLISIDMQPGEG